MADLAPVAASVQYKNDAKTYISWVKAGESVVQGEVVYKPSADVERLKADNTSAEKANAEGIVLTPAGDGEYMFIATNGAQLDLGITPANGVYVVSQNAGKIAPYSDLITGDDICVIGTVAAGILTVNIVPAGAEIP